MFEAWCKWAGLELLILEELSATLVGRIAELSGMTLLDHVLTLDVNDKPSTKCIAALVSTDGYSARVLRFPELETKRALLKVTNAAAKINVWGIHANASRSGGLEAVRCVNVHISSLAGTNDVVGGDFNCKIEHARGTCKAKNWNGEEVTFTQWSKRADSNVCNPSRYRECQVTKTILSPIKPQYLIDYVACGAAVTAVAQNNCKDEDMWRDILVQFDHCPIVYDLT